MDLVSGGLPQFGVTAFVPTVVRSPLDAYGPVLANLLRAPKPGAVRILGPHGSLQSKGLNDRMVPAGELTSRWPIASAGGNRPAGNSRPGLLTGALIFLCQVSGQSVHHLDKVPRGGACGANGQGDEPRNARAQRTPGPRHHLRPGSGQSSRRGAIDGPHQNHGLRRCRRTARVRTCPCHRAGSINGRQGPDPARGS
jgi:hypothetical protein